MRKECKYRSVPRYRSSAEALEIGRRRGGRTCKNKSIKSKKSTFWIKCISLSCVALIFLVGNVIGLILYKRHSSKSNSLASTVKMVIDHSKFSAPSLKTSHFITSFKRKIDKPDYEQRSEFIQDKCRINNFSHMDILNFIGGKSIISSESSYDFETKLIEFVPTHQQLLNGCKECYPFHNLLAQVTFECILKENSKKCIRYCKARNTTVSKVCIDNFAFSELYGKYAVDHIDIITYTCIQKLSTSENDLNQREIFEFVSSTRPIVVAACKNILKIPPPTLFDLVTLSSPQINCKGLV